jgi:hypothetical protein
MLSVDAIREDAARLHCFIEPLIRMCSDLREDYPVFADPSLEFFSYISKLGTKTQEYLETFPAYYVKSTDERSARSKRQALFTIKNSWETLHNYIRPALDADSLHLPMSLITAFSDIVNAVDDWKDYKFVLFHTNEANYLQIPAGMARKAANEIADSVSYERFDANLGLVGIPYSQSQAFFLNCLLPHEFAHFIYQEHSDADIEDRITSVLEDIVGTTPGLSQEDSTWCVRELGFWVEETFCDLLAVCMIGPAFSFALIELIGGSVLVGMKDGEPDDFYSFRDAYPAGVARLHFHHKLLLKLGWWDVIKDWKSSSIAALAQCETWSNLITIEGYIPPGITHDQLLQCYREVSEWLVDYCIPYFPSVKSQVQAFSSQSSIISEYLSRAIVPSTIIMEDRQVYPSPVVLLNSGLYFLFERLPELIARIHGEKQSSVEARSRIGSRLELWILKAIEDNRLLTRQVA